MSLVTYLAPLTREDSDNVSRLRWAIASYKTAQERVPAQAHLYQGLINIAEADLAKLEAKGKKWSWRDEPELMARLTRAQNHPANCDTQDIMTFAGFCDSKAELEAHVVRYEEKCLSYVPPRRKSRRGR
jgi:hypothetical protein